MLDEVNKKPAPLHEGALSDEDFHKHLVDWLTKYGGILNRPYNVFDNPILKLRKWIVYNYELQPDPSNPWHGRYQTLQYCDRQGLFSQEPDVSGIGNELESSVPKNSNKRNKKSAIPADSLF